MLIQCGVAPRRAAGTEGAGDMGRVMALNRELPNLATGEVVDLREYTRVLRRRAPIIVLCVVLVTGLAAAYAFLATPIYRSSATVFIKPTGVNSQDVPDPTKLIDPATEQAIVKSLPVAQIAARSIGGGSNASALLKNVSTGVTSALQTLTVSYSAVQPATAAEGANAFARAYLQFRQSQAESAVSQQVLDIQTKIQEAQKELRTLNAVIAQNPASAAARDARGQRRGLGAQLTVLQSNLISLSLLNTNPGQILNVAQIPRAPSSPNQKLDIALGVLVGLIVGVALAFLRDRMDEHLRRPEDVEGLLDAPLLARVPLEPGRGMATGLLSTRDRRTPTAEVFRALRTTLLASAATSGAKVVLVVSSVPDEGKSVVATNLAIVLAQAEKNVVLVSADLRKPTVHLFLNVHNAVGLTDVLEDDVSVDEVIQDSSIAHLRVLPSGAPTHGPTELLESRAMRKLLAVLRDRYDYVILDGAPLLNVADSLALAQLVDGVLIVADARRTTRSGLTEVRNQLGRVGANLLGAVLNKVPPSERSHRYGYGYGYGAEEARGDGRAAASEAQAVAFAGDKGRRRRRRANAR